MPTQPDDGAVSFPDANLEEAIRSAISKPSGSIYPADLESLTTLHASHSEISDLTGLEYCVNLNDLDLSHNNIKDIKPLVQNNGLSSGDTVNVGWNPLGSASIDYVKDLVDAGVEVLWGSL